MKPRWAALELLLIVAAGLGSLLYLVTLPGRLPLG